VIRASDYIKMETVKEEEKKEDYASGRNMSR